MKVPAAEISWRLANLRAAMQRERLSALYVTRREDVHYLSGFTGDESALLIASRRRWLITDFRYVEEAERSAPLFAVVTPPPGTSGARFAGDLARRQGVKRLGFASRHLSHAAWLDLRRGLRHGRLYAVDHLLDDLRAVKSAWEIKQIVTAVACAEAAFLALRRQLKAGMSETDICRELERQIRCRGAEPAFPTIVACGANASLPHAHPGKRRWRAGMPLLIDFGARVGFYNSDLTRVLFLGSLPRRWRERYEWVLAAQTAALAAMRAGVRCERPDAAARSVFAQHGCAEKFGHSLGHGVGLAVHDPPRLGQRNRSLLRPGMVVTVEPALYYPGQGGIRIEDMALIEH
ncbi:MAG: Xaa-Pro peptidase family protein, partial [Planctomycetota bacterium]|nr:Xaa-Pro peptidase family protein [Planctomycetota bacterium]